MACFEVRVSSLLRVLWNVLNVYSSSPLIITVGRKALPSQTWLTRLTLPDVIMVAVFMGIHTLLCPELRFVWQLGSTLVVV